MTTEEATAGPEFMEASARACIRALRNLEPTAIMLETHVREYYPLDADGKVHFIRALTDSAAESIRQAWGAALKEAELFGKPKDEQIERLMQWVADLQSDMYVNCVYCGHRYGPGETTPVSMADALKAHIAVCPEHPLSKTLTQLRGLIETGRALQDNLPPHWHDEATTNHADELTTAQVLIKEIVPNG